MCVSFCSARVQITPGDFISPTLLTLGAPGLNEPSETPMMKPERQSVLPLRLRVFGEWLGRECDRLTTFVSNFDVPEPSLFGIVGAITAIFGILMERRRKQT